MSNGNQEALGDSTYYIEQHWSITAVPASIIIISLVAAPFVSTVYPRAIAILGLIFTIKKLAYLLSTTTTVDGGEVSYRSGFSPPTTRSILRANVDSVSLGKMHLFGAFNTGKIVITATDGRSITIPHVHNPQHVIADIRTIWALDS